MNKMVLVPFSRYEHLMKKCESNKDPEKLDVLEEKTELSEGSLADRNQETEQPATEQDKSKEPPEERTIGERGPPGIKAKTNRGSGLIKHGSKRKGTNKRNKKIIHNWIHF